MEQLTFVDETSGGVSEQCSPNRVPFQADEKPGDFLIQEDEVAAQRTNSRKKGTTFCHATLSNYQKPYESPGIFL